ncbi:hypothetical protein [Streptomyces sp. NPDC046925]|uniref:hypothetical protein n=1 Tax=Streptomyces sp. NPDC046925 TaxID=3155375 RepID=UPI0033FF2AC9
MKNTTTRAAAVVLVAVGCLAVGAGTAAAGESDRAPGGGAAPAYDDAIINTVGALELLDGPQFVAPETVGDFSGALSAMGDEHGSPGGTVALLGDGAPGGAGLALKPVNGGAPGGSGVAPVSDGNVGLRQINTVGDE